jgi:hypothetical protein
MIRAMTLCLLAAPAWAQVPAPIAAAIKLCQTDGPSLAAREDALAEAGWRRLDLIGTDDAAAAFAPFELARLGRLEGSTEDLAEDLNRASQMLTGIVAQDLAGDAWFMLEDRTAYLRAQSRIGTDWACLIAADLPAADYAEMVGPVGEVREMGPMTWTALGDGAPALLPGHYAFDLPDWRSLPILILLLVEVAP